ncbi:response regulator [Thermodesulfobacteriota bacterium]
MLPIHRKSDELDISKAEESFTHFEIKPPLAKEKSGCILVVDDDKSILDFLSAVVFMMGYKAVACNNGEEALALFRGRSFDLVLTDMQMPKMDGLALSTHIKKESPRTPVVMITGQKDQTIVKKIKRIPIDYILFKPFTLTGIQETLQEILNRLQSNRGGV